MPTQFYGAAQWPKQQHPKPGHDGQTPGGTLRQFVLTKRVIALKNFASLQFL